MEQPKFNQYVLRVLEAHPGERICSFEYEGKKYWLKQAETLQGAMRMLKPNPQLALEKEKQTLEHLASRSAPVPRIVQSDKGYFVVEDAGVTVKDWLALKSQDQQGMQQILNDSAAALAGLHSMGLAHGRPALRDISWQQGQVTFIDFEANQKGKDMLMQQIRDLLVYIHSLYRYMGPANEAIAQAIASYRQAGGEAIWHETRSFLVSWQWLYLLLRPFRDIGGRDLKPIYWVLWHFRNIPA
ncbi:serine/threonine protein phosphatase [Shewanella algae]|uniref:phosphotransferase n=1 Tax=Shewanella algae TaxID=38313 RepID=UPI0011834560|nr:phosphotransferase [Shewanella algae]TVL52386.1 serine/threonine protein phosphatase [Shewanella algae]